MTSTRFMSLAIAQAKIGRSEGGIPIGAVLADDHDVLGLGHNRRIQNGSPVLHAEMDALANAGRLGPSVYRVSTMYTTLSPCAMCTGAILLYQIPRVVIGENRTFLGEEDLLRSRGIEVIVIGSEQCIRMMYSFIAEQPSLWGEDIGEETVLNSPEVNESYKPSSLCVREIYLQPAEGKGNIDAITRSTRLCKTGHLR